MMTIQESLNRAVNLVAVTITGLSAFAFLPEVFVENDVPDKIDDALLGIIGLVGIWWYSKEKNRGMRSLFPVILMVFALIVKTGGVIIEFSDKDAVGDDMGGLILFIIGTGLVFFLYKKTAKLLAEAATAK